MQFNKSNPDTIEKFVQALYRGVLRRNPDSSGMAHWIKAIKNGMSPSAAIDAFMESREFKNMSATKVFVPPGHFYSPIVDAAEAEKRLQAVAASGIQENLPGLNIERAVLVEMWNTILPYMKAAPFEGNQKEGLRYKFDNPAYAWGDGYVLHGMISHLKPKRIIEIGSGWSSACTIDTVDRNLNGQCELTFIDPYPKLLREIIGDAAARVTILAEPIQSIPLEMFDTLGNGDILFIDSTHVMRTGSDVCHELFEILPRLAQGVYVHIHDMFWPFEYPRSWVIDENRSWNELYGVRAFLTNNDSWRVVMFNDYMRQLETDLIRSTHPDFFKNSGGALWLRRTK